MRRSRFLLLIERELKSTLRGPRFPVVLAISVILILLSVGLGVREYQNAVTRLETGHQILAEEVEAADHWYAFNNRVYRKPDPMLILVAGVDYDVGRRAGVGMIADPTLSNSAYSDDPLFAFFRFFDFSFVVQVVLSLMAILVAYDAITGEREMGTLKMVMANSVARTTVVLAKFAGSWLALIVPLVLAMLLSVLVILFAGIPLTSGDWLRLSLLLVTGILYVTVFIAMGILASALTRRSATSFLAILSVWAIAVLVVPRLSTVAAGQIVETMSVAELEGKRSRFWQNEFRQMSAEMRKKWDSRSAESEKVPEDRRSEYFEQNQQKWAEEDDAIRKRTFAAVKDYARGLQEQRGNQTKAMELLALSLSRISPASTYQLASMQLAGTGLESKDHYLERLREYQTAYAAFLDEKMGLQARVSNEEPSKPSLAELPRFEHPKLTVRAALEPALFDIGLLVLYSLLAFSGAFVAFLRYDVR